MAYEEQKARDALAFDPLPESRWVRVDRDCISISTRYSEPLSRLLRSLPSSVWQPELQRWRLPFTSADAVRKAMAEIDRLAAVADANADEETKRREAGRQEAARRRREESIARQKELAERRPRSLRMEYLVPVAGRPLHSIELEAIGDDASKVERMMGVPPRHSVAQVMGSNGRGGWTRAYLRGAKDYAKSNSIGSRGVLVTYLLEEGPVYLVTAPVSWGSTDRYFLRIVGGQRVRMTDEEVRQCLAR